MQAFLFSVLVTAASFARSLVLGPLVELDAGGGGCSVSIGGGWGCSVSIDGDVMAVTNVQSVTMLKKNSTGWTIEAVLEEPNGYTNGFGNAVSVKGDTVVIGALFNRGRAYVFRRLENGSWPLEAILLHPDTPVVQYYGYYGFGWSVAFDKETAVIGAPLYTQGGWLSEAGVAYVFVRSGNSWSLQANLTAGDPDVAATFGGGVSIYGNRILVLGGGAVYLFERENDSWTQVAKLAGSVPLGSYNAGQQGVFVRGNTLVASGKRSVNVFMRNMLVKRPKTIKPFDQKGGAVSSVALSESEDIIAVGAAGFGVYLYQRNGSNWVKEFSVHAPPATPSWGGSVGISGSTFVFRTDTGAYAIEVAA